MLMYFYDVLSGYKEIADGLREISLDEKIRREKAEVDGEYPLDYCLDP